MSGLEFETSWIPTMGIGELSGMPDEMLLLRGVGGEGVNLRLTGIPSGARNHSPGHFMLWKPG